ncbi:DUF1657 domain-containing protein [Oceanobacillus piezotolerans]|uniref:DUF1657 domain-containing protein n=1 Tax=Oceanobacillus piezotolerans TaxID=2448030 RepID=A0A498D620_9BACI|nr:DUF1657 domain-containing protein [Oceanobacillus piezotolerans]RLL45158.1 DUF1657 domain-containing protein [Oceanobacillus piezotolerans]
MTVGSQVKGTFASVKNIEANLDLLANKVQEAEAQQAFSEVQQIITEIKQDLEKQIIYLSRQEPQY